MLNWNPSKRELLKETVEHIDIKQYNVVPLVEAMKSMAYSARDLARAAEIYDRMVRDHMERTASILSYEQLGNGRATVGFEVCVKHVAAAAEGARCTVRATLREVVDGRKLRFDVEVTEGERTIGVGTHERRVIDVGVVKSE